jgi:hypothetical protein
MFVRNPGRSWPARLPRRVRGQASSSTTAADLPPSSIATGFTSAAASPEMRLPASVDRVSHRRPAEFARVSLDSFLSGRQGLHCEAQLSAPAPRGLHPDRTVLVLSAQRWLSFPRSPVRVKAARRCDGWAGLASKTVGLWRQYSRSPRSAWPRGRPGWFEVGYVTEDGACAVGVGAPGAALRGPEGAAASERGCGGRPRPVSNRPPGNQQHGSGGRTRWPPWA